MFADQKKKHTKIKTQDLPNVGHPNFNLLSGSESSHFSVSLSPSRDFGVTVVDGGLDFTFSEWQSQVHWAERKHDKQLECGNKHSEGGKWHR